jgi:ABC-type Fe3+/spermidine/putrescine transport system ATPase subunit
MPLRARQRVSAGTRVSVAVRPEHVTISSDPHGGRGVVEETLYFGNVLKCIVRVGPHRIITSMPTRGDFVPQPGDRVRLRVDGDAAVVFTE